jgi:hypothetical protein
MAETTYVDVVWTAGDIITEAKMDNMTANDRAVDAMAQGIQLLERANPSTPPANNLHLYCKDKDGVSALYYIDDAGTVFEFLNLVKTTDTQTLTNKRIDKRVTSITSSATPTPNANTDDEYNITALTETATFGAPTGSPINGQTLLIRIKDDGTARALAFNAIYRFSADMPAPTTTTISKTIYLGFIYNSADSKWDCIAYIDRY